MAYKTITTADAEKYPAMKDSVGKTVSFAQYRTMQRNSKTAAPAASASAPAKAPAKKAAAKKATAKKAAPKKK